MVFSAILGQTVYTLTNTKATARAEHTMIIIRLIESGIILAVRGLMTVGGVAVICLM